MTPAESLAQHRAFIGEDGENVTVRRYAADRSKTDIVTKARVIGYLPQQLVGAIVQGDRKVIALVDTLSGLLPLTNADKLVIRGRELAIKSIDDNTRRVAGVLIALEIQAGG